MQRRLHSAVRKADEAQTDNLILKHNNYHHGKQEIHYL